MFLGNFLRLIINCGFRCQNNYFSYEMPSLLSLPAWRRFDVEEVILRIIHFFTSLLFLCVKETLFLSSYFSDLVSTSWGWLLDSPFYRYPSATGRYIFDQMCVWSRSGLVFMDFSICKYFTNVGGILSPLKVEWTRLWK